MTIRNESHMATLERLRALSNVLDNAIGIPGTRFRIGIDPLLGLLPGAGDWVGAVLSAYIIYSGYQLGLPRETVGQMVFNVILETFAGTIPVLGDLFDVTWKANMKNIALLENHLQVPPPAGVTRKKAEGWFVFLLLAGLILFAIAISALGIWLIANLIQLITR